MGFTLALLTLAAADTWKSKFYEDITLHRGQPLVTIQVAWQQDKELASAASGLGI